MTNWKDLSQNTLNSYDKITREFDERTRDHDVSQNYRALLSAMPGEGPYHILDFGCGPGRDLRYFKKLGHFPVGLEGSPEFVKLASELSGAPVVCQNFNQIEIGSELRVHQFDGVFANATLQHVIRDRLSETLQQIAKLLKPRGVLFFSIPRGEGESVFEGKYSHRMELDTFLPFLERSGFELEYHYYRPSDAPPAEQKWLAGVARVFKI